MKKTLFITGICAALLLIAFFLSRENTNREDPRGHLYAGSEACTKCHSDIYHSYLHTAHFLASLPATENTIHGSFENGSNVFYVNDSQKVVMEKLDSGLFQSYYLDGKIKKRYRFDIVFGGVKGESYLTWNGNELEQLPLSYFTREHQWSTSPGYGFNFLEYPRLRMVSKSCLECHTSYINNFQGESPELNKTEFFDKSSLVYSIDCERCHGPAAQHVAFQTRNPEIKTAHFIRTYSSLNRIQRMDMCAICHSGPPSLMIRSTFEFAPGDTFAKFKVPEFSRILDTEHLDVHGNQVGLLERSKCYIYSQMDCATCHDVHKNTRGEDILYVQKCLDCHNTPNHVYCKMSNKLSESMLEQYCINCHMPALPTKVISVQVSDKLPTVQFFVHTHRIAIYPMEVKKILAYINQ